MSRISSFELIASVGLSILVCSAHLRAEAEIESRAKSGSKEVSNYEVFGKGRNRRDSKIHYMQSEMALNISDINRSVKEGRRAVELDPNDIDAYVALGEALYQKVKHQKKDDPYTYNECIKTWLMVHRNIVGDESGMTLKGIELPLAVKFFEDDDRGVRARERLTALCGRTPKFWETNKKFLAKVLKPEMSVSGKVLESSSGAKNNESR